MRKMIRHKDACRASESDACRYRVADTTLGHRGTDPGDTGGQTPCDLEVGEDALGGELHDVYVQARRELDTGGQTPCDNASTPPPHFGCCYTAQAL